jgi:HK97 family phage major capsid protein
MNEQEKQAIIDEMASKVQNATQEQMDSFKNQLEALDFEALNALKGKNFAEKQDFDNLKDLVDEVNESLKEIKDLNEQNVKTNKGIYVDFAEKNAKDFNKNDKGYERGLTIKAPALMTTANVTPNVTGGFSPLFGNYIDGNIGEVPKADPVITPLVNVITAPGTEKIWWTERTNEEGDAEFIGEGDLKPLVDAEWATYSDDIFEVAERWKFSKRLMNHAPSVIDNFRTHANELIENKIDDTVLSGDNSNNSLEFNGLEAVGTAFIVPTQLANYYAGANIFDAINAVATFVRLNNFKGSLTCILNPVWKAIMQGIKDKDDNYIIPPFVTQDGMQVGEVRVVFSNRFDAAKIILGDLKKFNLVMSEDVSYDEGYENDDFSRNLVSRKLEAFMGSYIKGSDAGSIVSDDISTILSAIATIEP